MSKHFSINLTLGLMFALAGCDSNTTSSSSTEPGSQVTAAATTTPTVQPPAIIEPSVLFGNPSRFQGRLSPDGAQMSFRAPLDGVMNLWVGDRGDYSSVKAITNDQGRGIPSHFGRWTANMCCTFRTRMVMRTGICTVSI